MRINIFSQSHLIKIDNIKIESKVAKSKKELLKIINTHENRSFNNFIKGVENDDTDSVWYAFSIKTGVKSKNYVVVVKNGVAKVTTRFGKKIHTVERQMSASDYNGQVAYNFKLHDVLEDNFDVVTERSGTEEQDEIIVGLKAREARKDKTIKRLKYQVHYNTGTDIVTVRANAREKAVNNNLIVKLEEKQQFLNEYHEAEVAALKAEIESLKAEVAALKAEKTVEVPEVKETVEAVEDTIKEVVKVENDNFDLEMFKEYDSGIIDSQWLDTARVDLSSLRILTKCPQVQKNRHFAGKKPLLPAEKIENLLAKYKTVTIKFNGQIKHIFH